jgi:hypothetical protein
MKKMLLFVILILLVSYKASPQAYYLEQYDGIPIIAFANVSAENLAANNAAMNTMKNNIGVFGFYAQDISPATYNIFVNKGIKMFPDQVGWQGNNNDVVYYSKGVFTKWNAVGGGHGGDTKIEFNSDIGVKHGNYVITKVPSTQGDLIYGPYYYQYINYKDEVDASYNPIPVLYTASFRIKIEKAYPELPDPVIEGFDETVVCTIKVVATDAGENEQLVAYRELKVGEFKVNQSYWGNWKDFDFDYNLLNLKNLTHRELMFPREASSAAFSSEFMQFKVEFAGNPNIRLAVESITVSDERGRGVMTDPAIQGNIRNLVSQFSDENHVLGWFGVNEPPSIDNYQPIRKINELIKEVNDKLSFFTTFSAMTYGRYTWWEFYKGVNDSSISPAVEFIKQTGLNYISLNSYIYDNVYVDPAWGIPGHPTSPDYKIKNINNYVIHDNLNKIVNAGIPLSYSTQTGRFYSWKFDEATSECINEFPSIRIPNPAEMVYHINLGLLFGAKELTIDPLFTIPVRADATAECDDPDLYPYREGLIDIDTGELTPLGGFFSNKIPLMLSGEFGKTLKRLNPVYRVIDYKPSPSPTENNVYWLKKVELANPNPNPANSTTIDYGFFENPNLISKKYLMVVNRY